jgi:hypothetical protein
VIKLFSAALLLLALSACNSTGADADTRPAPKSATGKTLPVAPPPPPMQEEAGSCAADVRQCADGSFVSRDPVNNCAFNPCPGEGKP